MKNTMKNTMKNKTNKKQIFIQCGWEDRCSKKDCINCPRKRKHKMNMTLAEEICVEDFAMCNLDAMINGGEISKECGITFPGKKKEVDLMQNVMRKLMHKMFKTEEKTKWDKSTSK